MEWFREGTSLRIEVHNPGFPASVRMRCPDSADAHGRGLLLVDAVADPWHSGPSRLGGTVVSVVVADAGPAQAGAFGVTVSENALLPVIAI